MIEIKNITKIFKDKKKDNEVVALNDVSFNLPEKGLIFINGKSGSGKSTLLNLIGGLDTPTSGQIFFNKNDITKFSFQQFNRYRSGYIGFVFQDYHLLDELTVEENINFFAYKKEGSFSFEEILELTDLKGLEKRHINELSGGQKQRVAIARAVLKNPLLLLCDEPTGNLDENTSAQILELLKQISKRILVVVVSHNQKDSELYGDRIITLVEGKIDNDITKTPNNLPLIDGEVVNLPYRQNLSKEDVETINKQFELGKISKINAVSSGFFKTNDKEITSIKKSIKGRPIDKKTFTKLHNKFLSRKKFSSFIQVVVSTLLIIVLSFCGSLGTLNTNEIISYDMHKNNEVAKIFYKSVNGSTTIIEDYVKDDLTSLGYDDVVSEIHPFTLLATNKYSFSGLHLRGSISSKVLLSTDSFHLAFSAGLMTISEDNLLKLFAEKGKINVLAGDIYDESGFIVTDLFADSLIYHQPDKYKCYEDVLGFYSYNLSGGINNNGKITAVIDTDYDIKYESLIECFNSNGDVREHKLYNQYLHDIHYKFYAFAFTLNFEVLDLLSNYEYVSFANLSGFYAQNEYGLVDLTSSYNYILHSHNKNKNLNPGEIILNLSTYNRIFNTSLDSSDIDSFVPCNITLVRTSDNDMNEKVLFKKTYKVVGLTTGNYIYTNLDDGLEIFRYQFSPTRHVLFDLDKIGIACKYYNDNDYLNTDSAVFNSTMKYLKMLLVFQTLFILISILLVVIIVFLLVSSSVKYIKENRYQIGILKAMGASTLQLSGVFVLRTLIIGVLITIISTIGIYVLNPTFNDLLRQAGYSLIRSHFKIDTILLSFNNLLIMALFVLGIVFVASLMPVLALHRVRPIDILRERE